MLSGRKEEAETCLQASKSCQIPENHQLVKGSSSPRLFGEKQQEQSDADPSGGAGGPGQLPFSSSALIHIAPTAPCRQASKASTEEVCGHECVCVHA